MRLAALASIAGLVAFSSTASAGVIATENARAGFGWWTVSKDGTANGAGVVDVYAADHSIVAGNTLRLKVRSTTSYSVRILRLGWYGGKRSRQIAYSAGFAADPQPYPSADASYGMAEARWHDSASFSTAGWPAGFYVARVERGDGYMAETPFVVRDDNTTRMPVLMLLSTTTNQAYNAWPGAKRGGKSLYGFNSSSAVPSQGTGGRNQAVKVSFDRPYLVGGGTADFGNYEYPMAAFLEQNGWDVAYAMDSDLQTNPELVKNRKAVIIVGHSEYWSRGMFDAVVAARDTGVNFFIASGDTLSWQVRFENGVGPLSTLVGYKESWVHDPEQKTAYSLDKAGRYAEAAAHFRYVTRGWKSLQYTPSHGIDERRPGILFTGVMSSGQIKDASGNGTWYPWADLKITNSTHWLYKGSGAVYGTRIPKIMGYEVDSTQASNSTWDKWRPPNQVRIGSIIQLSDGVTKGSAAAYWKTVGTKRVEVVAMGAIAFSWGLDDFAQAGSTNAIAKKMVNNAMDRWVNGFTAAADDFGVDQDPTPDPALEPNENDSPSNAAEPESEANANGVSCTVGSGSSDLGVVGFTLGALGLAVALRRRRR